MAFTPPTLASETVTYIGTFPIRNSILMSWLAVIVLVIFALIYKKKGGHLIPKGFQNFVESIVELLYNFFHSITQDHKQTRKFFPIVATFFIFVITSNWMGILPGVGSIGFWEEPHGEEVTEEHAPEPEKPTDYLLYPEPAVTTPTATESNEAHESDAALPLVLEDPDEESPATETDPHEGLIFVPLFRSTYADINTTLALALISVIATQIYGILSLGFGSYAGKFFVNPLKDPIGTFVGFLEIISEFAKVISFSFRLFGNIFAGEILLTVISFLSPFIAPIPFYGLEIFVGFVQALVFSLLTLVFMKMAATAHH